MMMDSYDRSVPDLTEVTTETSYKCSTCGNMYPIEYAQCDVCGHICSVQTCQVLKVSSAGF